MGRSLVISDPSPLDLDRDHVVSGASPVREGTRDMTCARNGVLCKHDGKRESKVRDLDEPCACRRHNSPLASTSGHAVDKTLGARSKGKIQLWVPPLIGEEFFGVSYKRTWI